MKRTKHKPKKEKEEKVIRTKKKIKTIEPVKMERTKKAKPKPKGSIFMSRTRNNGKYSGQFPYGGHIPWPPESCPNYHKIKIGRDGVKWLDIGICMRNCSSKIPVKGTFGTSFCEYANKQIEKLKEKSK